METETDSLKNRIFRIASRNSSLAMKQTYEVIDLLISQSKIGLTPENFQIVQVASSEGDQNLKDPLYVMGGVGVFTKNVERELKLKNADIAVHSLKDLPTEMDEELTLGAIPPLKPRHDVLIAKSDSNIKAIDELPKNSIIGTSSLRRITSLSHKYPHLVFKNIRGNLNTRLKKLEEGEYDAIILAYAGISRLGFESKITQNLDEKIYLYAPGQGALGVQCRKNDEICLKLLKFIDDRDARARCEMERQFLNRIEGGCKLPIAVYSEISGDKMILLGQVWDLKGKTTIQQRIEGLKVEKNLGSTLAQIMKEKGADEILDEIKKSETVLGSKK